MSLWLVGLLCGLAARGQDVFNPESPAEPGVPPVPLVLQASPSDGGRLSGAGRYVPGTAVRVSATPNAGFVFEQWTDAEGRPVSSSASFNYTKGEGADTLVARFAYRPASPDEPSEPSAVQYFTLTLSAGTGGSVSGGGRYQAGTSVRLSASCQQNFEFVAWTDATGAVVSTSRTFNYVTRAVSEQRSASTQRLPMSLPFRCFPTISIMRPRRAAP